MIRSNGYNNIVEADPPAMPAKKDERGVVVFADEGFSGCCEADDDDDTVFESLMAKVTANA